MRWSDIPFDPPESTLRQFAGLWVAAFGGIAAWQAIRGRPTLAVAIGLLAASGVVGLVRPRIARPIFVGWMVAAFPIGWAVSNLILVLIFYGLFLPIGLAHRLAGRDPLGRKPSPGATTYWRPRQAPADVRRYFRQF